MLDAVEHALLALDVAPDRIHTERFDWVREGEARDAHVLVNRLVVAITVILVLACLVFAAVRA